MEGPVPQLLPTCRPPTIFERDPPEQKTEQHQYDWHIKRRHDHGVGERKDREQAATAENKPRFVAIPDGRHRIHRDVALAGVLEEWEKNADTKIETVKHHVGKHGKRYQAGPDKGEIERHSVYSRGCAASSGFTPAIGVVPAV